MWYSAIPLLKVASPVVGLVVFTGLVYVIMNLGPPSTDPQFDYSTMSRTPEPGGTVVPGNVTIAVGGTPIVLPTRPAPPAPLPLPTVIPGRDQGGLFGDGLINLPRVDISNWKAYSNTKYGYAFKYPPDWELDESENTSQGPNGEPYFPMQFVRVRNPASQRGQNIPNVNCRESECVALAPTTLSFGVGIGNRECMLPGALIARMNVTLAGKQSTSCTFIGANDKQSRETEIAILYDNQSKVIITLGKGRQVTVDGQTILETILASFTIR